MYKKNIKVGALVLALSFSVANLQGPLHTNTVYASEVSAPTSENSAVDANSLKSLVDESANVKKSKKYNNATQSEKKAYDDAIANASSELDKENPANIEKLYQAIKDAMDKLSGNVYVTSDARDGLSSTIAMASKLAADEALDETNKNSLNEAIDKAKGTLADVEKSTDEIDKANSDLASLIDKIVSEKKLDASKYVLSGDELSNLESAELAAYGKARTNLLELINNAKKFHDANKSAGFDNKLADAINAGVDVYNNVNAETDALQKAYDGLNKALSDAQLAKDENNTELSRLKSNLESLVNENFAGKDKANKIAQRTYENALAYGKTVLEKKDANPADYQRAIKSISMAKLALKPVETKTIDDGKTEIQRAIEKLNRLIEEADTIKNSNDYKNADKDSKDAYDIAIEEAKKLNEKDKESLEKVNSAIGLIESAKVGFGKTSDDNEELKAEAKALLDKLNTYTSDKENVKSSNSYRQAKEDLKTAYDEAIKEALALQTKKANEKAITLEELKTAVDKVEKALKDIGYDAKTTYPNDLQALVEEASEFRKEKKFTDKALSGNDYEKRLINTYNERIEEAKKYLNSGKNDQATLDDYATVINNLKKAILDEISQVELDLRGELRKANRLISKESFKTAESSADEDKKKIADDYKELIEKANSIIANENRSDADMSKLVEDLKNARTVIENLDPQNIAIAKINDYMEPIRKVYNHPKYLKVAQNNKTRLENAVKAVEDTDFTKEVSQDKLDSLISDLEAGLNASDIKAIVEEIKKNKETKLEDLVVKELVDVAKEVQNHPDFNGVTQTNKKSLNEALVALEAAIESNNKEDIEAARTRLISMLNAQDIKKITQEVLAKRSGKTDTGLEKKTEQLQQLIAIGEKVQSHKNYESIKDELKEELADAISKAKAAVTTEDASKIDQAFNKLNEVLAKERFKDILKDIKDSMVNDYKTKINEFIKGDASFRREIKYIKAQKSLKEAYIKALDDAKKLIEKSDASSEEIKDAYDKLFDARKELDGDKFEERFEALAKKYKDNSDKITDSKIKAAIADKINALNEDGKAMDDLIAVEKELTNALPKEGAKVSVTTTRGGVQTPVTTTSTKTVPVTTTKSVPTTVTPGSIVRTGIDSVIGYVAVLAIAILGYVFVSKKGKKDNTTDKNEKKTFQGDKNE
ncbi:coiled-coil domain-containing protein [Anaerococcus provencensis]|uniref:FIVAR domain-containing protein n=1 Tax=Anaerococcus provencensis TaxID=938293 RepID=UPI0003150452|nr:FIVAR domain-containing protein [Anaerococcus provencensis]